MFDQILSIIFPEKCRGCNTQGTALCLSCQKDIPMANTIFEPSYSFAVWDYHNQIVQKAVWELKYHRKSPTAKILILAGIPAISKYINNSIKDAATTEIFLVPIPQHQSKTRDRGFNQSMLIARWIQQAIPRLSIVQILQKTRSTVAQAHTVSRIDRQRNLADSMRAIGVAKPDALYIIIDDVITTGSTIQEASRALRAAGVKHICAIALAHGYARK